MSNNVLSVDKNNFESEVLKSNEPVIVDFWAPWCGPCRMLAPVMEQLGEQYNGKVKIAKVNVDENQSISGQYNITSIPAIILFKDGKAVEKMVGARPKSAFEEMINKNL